MLTMDDLNDAIPKSKTIYLDSSFRNGVKGEVVPMRGTCLACVFGERWGYEHVCERGEVHRAAPIN